MPTRIPVMMDDAASLRARLDMLREAFSAVLTVEELIVIAVAQAKAAAHAAGGVLFLLDGDELEVAAGDGYPPNLLKQWSRFAVSANTPAGTAVRERKAQWLSRPVEKIRRYPELAPERTGFVALAALPVMSGSSVLGVLGISFRDARDFSPMERLFLLLLADQVGDTLDRVRRGDRHPGVLDQVLLADPARRQAVSESLVVLEQARDTIDRSAALAAMMCETAAAQLSLIGRAQVVAGGSGAAPQTGSVSPADESLCTVTMSLRRPLVVADTLADDRLTSFPPVRSGDVRAYLGVPVLVHGTPVGAFCVYDRHPRAWSRQDQALLAALAAGIGTELTLRTKVARHEGLLEAADAHGHLLDRLTAAENVRQTTAILLEALTDVEGVAGSVLVVTDEQTGRRQEQIGGSGPDAAAALAELARRGPTPEAPMTRTWGRDDLIDVLLGDTAYLVELGTTQVLQVFMPGRAALGSLVVALTGRADAGQIRQQLLDLAQVGGAVLDRAVTLERHRLATSRAAFLSAASEQMQASLDVDETLQRMARIAVPALADGCLVYLADPGGLRLAAASHVDVRMERRIRPELGNDPAFRRLVESALRGTSMAVDVLPTWLGGGQPRLTPMRARGRLVGVIVLLGSGRDGPGQLADDALMTDLAAHAAITIDNALMYARRTADVSALQYRLLPPRLPIVPDFSMAAFYEAGDRSLDVGGDFYDVIAAGEDRLVLLVGDVCGRGAEAAAITGMARAVLRTVVQDGAPPARALERLNDAMRSAGDRGEFCTAVVAQIDGHGDNCRLRMAVAGHPLPLLRHAGETTEFGRHGPMIGLLPAPVFRESETALSCDDVLLLYTDGITEARRGDHFFGSRLISAMAEAGRSAESVITHALNSVERFRDESNDDIAMLALRPRGHFLARIELADLADPANRAAVLALIDEIVPDLPARRRLSRRAGRSLARLQLSVTGPATVDVLRTPATWRVEFSRTASVSEPVGGRRDSRARRTAVVPGSIRRVRHGAPLLDLLEVGLSDA
jgi:GAF domain-containing protein